MLYGPEKGLHAVYGLEKGLLNGPGKGKLVQIVLKRLFYNGFCLAVTFVVWLLKCELKAILLELVVVSRIAG